jgi:hypothetical protein
LNITCSQNCMNRLLFVICVFSIQTYVIPWVQLYTVEIHSQYIAALIICIVIVGLEVGYAGSR